MGKPIGGADVNDLTASWCITGKNIVKIHDYVIDRRASRQAP